MYQLDIWPHCTDMDEINDNKKSKGSDIKLSFLISFIYVSFATLVCYLDGYNHYIPTGLALILYLLFLPAIVFPNLILYAEGDGASSVPYLLVCQTITLIGIWLLTFIILKTIRKRNKRKKTDT